MFKVNFECGFFAEVDSYGWTLKESDKKTVIGYYSNLETTLLALTRELGLKKMKGEVSLKDLLKVTKEVKAEVRKIKEMMEDGL